MQLEKDFVPAVEVLGSVCQVSVKLCSWSMKTSAVFLSNFHNNLQFMNAKHFLSVLTVLSVFIRAKEEHYLSSLSV